MGVHDVSLHGRAGERAKFKVGDRVRRINQDNSAKMRVGSEWTVSETIGPDWFYVEGYVGGCNAENFEPAPLSIQAGRYYKTRDGRKVGPMERRHHDSVHTWQHDNGWRIYKSDGTNYEPGERDIIAEWPTPTGCAAAEVDNLRAEYGGAASVPKFKVGDKVRFTDECDKGWFFGPHTDVKEGVIVDQQRDMYGYEYAVSLVHSFSGDGYVNACHIEHITHTTPAIVCLIEDGQPKPATKPYVHSDREAATKEASRLASLHKGQEFGVYELVTSVKRERVYAHEWQRLAAGGERVAACKELRSYAGVSLKAAVTAVDSFKEYGY